jgi:hypothetical protein
VFGARPGGQVSSTLGDELEGQIRSNPMKTRLSTKPIIPGDRRTPRVQPPQETALGPYRSPVRPGPVAAKACPAATHPRLGRLCRSSESLSHVEGSAAGRRYSRSRDIRIRDRSCIGDPLSVPRAVPGVPPGQADPVVFVHPNAVLSFSRFGLGFLPVTRRDPRLLNTLDRVQQFQLPCGKAFVGRLCGRPLTEARWGYRPRPILEKDYSLVTGPDESSLRQERIRRVQVQENR